MQPTLHARPFTAPGWLFEMKLDGFRALVRRRGVAVELLSRRGRVMNDQFPEIVVRLRRIPGDWVMDGELVVPDVGGDPSFEGSRRRSVMRRPHAIATAARETPAALCLFDLLLIQDRDLRSLAQVERKQRLRELVPEGGGLQIVKSIESHGEALFTKACELDIEGIVAKRIDASYVAGPQIAWLKIKNRNYSRQEALGFG